MAKVFQEERGWVWSQKDDGILFLESMNPEAVASAACLQRGTVVSVTERAQGRCSCRMQVMETFMSHASEAGFYPSMDSSKTSRMLLFLHISHRAPRSVHHCGSLC